MNTTNYGVPMEPPAWTLANPPVATVQDQSIQERILPTYPGYGALQRATGRTSIPGTPAMLAGGAINNFIVPTRAEATGPARPYAGQVLQYPSRNPHMVYGDLYDVTAPYVNSILPWLEMGLRASMNARYANPATPGQPVQPGAPAPGKPKAAPLNPRRETSNYIGESMDQATAIANALAQQPKTIGAGPSATAGGPRLSDLLATLGIGGAIAGSMVGANNLYNKLVNRNIIEGAEVVPQNKLPAGAKALPPGNTLPPSSKPGAPTTPPNGLGPTGGTNPQGVPPRRPLPNVNLPPEPPASGVRLTNPKVPPQAPPGAIAALPYDSSRGVLDIPNRPTAVPTPVADDFLEKMWAQLEQDYDAINRTTEAKTPIPQAAKALPPGTGQPATRVVNTPEFGRVTVPADSMYVPGAQAARTVKVPGFGNVQLPKGSWMPRLDGLTSRLNSALGFLGLPSILMDAAAADKYNLGPDGGLQVMALKQLTGMSLDELVAAGILQPAPGGGLQYGPNYYQYAPGA